MAGWFFYVVGTVALEHCNESADPSCLSFQHTVLFAENEQEALLEGQRALGFHQEPGLIKNDYAFPARL